MHTIHHTGGLVDWNNQEPEGAFCVISGNGARFYGDTRQEANDAMIADAAATSRTLARFGTDFLPADVVEALPALPDGYEYLVLERMRYEANGRFDAEGDERCEPRPYEWRTFAVPRLGGRGNGNAAVAWRSGKRVYYDVGRFMLVPDDRVSGLFGFAGRGPAIARHLDVPYRSDEIALPHRSLEFADGAWVPRTTIDVPYRNGLGEPLPAMPDGYGAVLITDTDDDGCGDHTEIFAMPFGTHALSMPRCDGSTRDFAVVTAGHEPTLVSHGECLHSAPTLPACTLGLRNGAWVAYDRATWYGKTGWRFSWPDGEDE